MDYMVDQLPLIPAEFRPTLKKLLSSLFIWADWFCGTRDPREIFDVHSSFLCNELIFYLCGLLTFIHAWRAGNRYWWTWIAVLFHGLNVELLTYILPDFESFWHAQSMLVFWGRRLPAHILLVYPIFMYTAHIAAKRLRLPWYAEACAVGLGAVLIDIPYDIMGIKQLWWTWHDTDPNIADRMYHVPWTSYYFHAAFACSFTLLLNGTRKLFLHAEYDWKRFPLEFLCCIIAGLGAFWLGALQFIPIYHVLHDMFGVHTEVTCFIFLGIYVLVVWTADREPKKEARIKEFWWWFDELFMMLLIYYLFFMVLAIVADPENVESIGLHQPIGSCHVTTSLRTVSGMVLKRKKYLCAVEYDEPSFDFHCLPNGRPPKAKDQAVEWYKICGTAFQNQVEYVVVVWSFCLFALYVFYRWLVCSGKTPQIPVRKFSKKKQQ